MKNYSEALELQRSRAMMLSNMKACPHCQSAISLLDMLSMVRGHGWSLFVTIQLENGERQAIRERDFNPQTMLLAETDLTSPSATGPSVPGPSHEHAAS